MILWPLSECLQGQGEMLNQERTWRRDSVFMVADQEPCDHTSLGHPFQMRRR